MRVTVETWSGEQRGPCSKARANVVTSASRIVFGAEMLSATGARRKLYSGAPMPSAIGGASRIHRDVGGLARRRSTTRVPGQASCRNPAGVPILISAPSAARRARVSGEEMLSPRAALSLSMTAGGVPAGATTPSQNGAMQLRIARLFRGRYVGQFRSCVRCRESAVGAQPPGLDVRQAGRHRVGDRWTSPATMAVSIGAVPR